MLPVLTPSQMAAADAAAPELIDELIGRAGRAVARVALDMLGGSYGRVVVVIVGKGHNGADGRVAAAVLRRRAQGPCSAHPSTDGPASPYLGLGARGARGSAPAPDRSRHASTRRRGSERLLVPP